jgi:hypothetical protein
VWVSVRELRLFHNQLLVGVASVASIDAAAWRRDNKETSG